MKRKFSYAIPVQRGLAAGLLLTAGAILTACNDEGPTGPAGSGITWTDVTASSIQAQSNKGYAADSFSRVTITLPASASVGDIVSVAGAGTGGWLIAQNAGQTILTEGIPAWHDQSSSGQRDWVSIASSADGTHLAAVDSNDGYIYTSTDSGVTWTQQTGSGQRLWYSIASSSDGTHLAAGDWNGGYMYTSNDSGVTWTPQYSGGRNAWRSIASSASGTHLAAGVSNGDIYSGSFATQTTLGTSGSLGGYQYDEVQLQYLDNGVWNVTNFVSHSGEMQVH